MDENKAEEKKVLKRDENSHQNVWIPLELQGVSKRTPHFGFVHSSANKAALFKIVYVFQQPGHADYQTTHNFIPRCNIDHNFDNRSERMERTW